MTHSPVARQVSTSYTQRNIHSHCIPHTQEHSTPGGHLPHRMQSQKNCHNHMSAHPSTNIHHLLLPLSHLHLLLLELSVPHIHIKKQTLDSLVRADSCDSDYLHLSPPRAPTAWRFPSSQLEKERERDRERQRDEMRDAYKPATQIATTYGSPKSTTQVATRTPCHVPLTPRTIQQES